MAVEKIQYQAGNVTGHGALVWNEKVSGKRPLLLVMPNWLGVTETIVKRAAKMAGDKYVAFVADMYGNGRTSEGPPESGELMMAVRAGRLGAINWGAVQAGVAVMTVPCLIVFLLLQRYYMRGLMAGAVK